VTSPLADRAAAIEPTSIREFRSMAGPETLDLGIGQTDQPIPEEVESAIDRHLADGRAPYSDNLGAPEARRAVGEHVRTDGDHVMLTCGAQEALAVAILGLVDDGDDVLVPDPGFPAFPNLVRAAGGRPVRYKLQRPSFTLDADAIRRAATDDTTAIVVCHPGNPTGRIHDSAELSSVLRWANHEGVTWISDETYELYCYDDQHTPARDLAANPDSGIICGGLSKTLHIMGWRIGWLIADDALVSSLKPLHQHLVTCAPTFAQRVAADVVPDLRTTFQPTLDTFRQRRELVRGRVSSLAGVTATPMDGAFYTMLDVRSHLDEQTDDRDLAVDILEQTDVALIPGSGFGPNGSGFLRLAYTRDIDTLIEAFDRLSDFFG
jgi:aspartate/methionine/tyrosine aminotransferase